jgi:hypothetical protein
MKRETGSFKPGVLPLSLALICVCGNGKVNNDFVNCNEDGIPCSIWEAWAEDGFDRPEGFTEPPSTPYGFCVLCPECGRFYSEKEMELTGTAVVSGKVDPSENGFEDAVKGWKEHNDAFFRKYVDRKEVSSGKQSPVAKLRPRSNVPRPDRPVDYVEPADPWNP